MQDNIEAFDMAGAGSGNTLYDESRRQPIDSLFFLFIISSLFIPRPTIDHAAKYLAPASILILVYIYLLWFFCNRVPVSPNKTVPSHFLLFIASTILSIYGIRILIEGESSEYLYLVARILSFALLMVMISWMLVRNIPLKSVYKTLFYGYLLLSPFIVFIGITGIPLFGEVRPPRTFGFQVPFHKTAAISRSYGEFGIFASAAWAYFLVCRQHFRPYKRYLILLTLLLSLLISQSRSTYIAVMLVTATYFVLKFQFSRRFAIVIFLVALILPLFVSTFIPILEGITPFKYLVGEGIYKANITSRIVINDMAIDLMTQDFRDIILGINHSDWSYSLYNYAGFETVLHNHFLSNLIFLGFVGGGIYLLIYLIPMFKLVNMIGSWDDECRIVVLALIGMFTCLQFYEGFFSIITMIVLSTAWRMSDRSSINELQE